MGWPCCPNALCSFWATWGFNEPLNEECFPGGSEGKASACNAGDLGSIPGSGRSPGEGNGNPGNGNSSILAWRIPWTEEPGGLQSRGSQSRTQLSNFTFTFYRASLVAHEVKNPPAMQETWVRSLSQKDPLEKGMTTHFIILAWRIPWTGEPGGLQSMDSQRVVHN